jgi:protein-S-isoprenylcysteine O-methyltransferase Ste14
LDFLVSIFGALLTFIYFYIIGMTKTHLQKKFRNHPLEYRKIIASLFIFVVSLLIVIFVQNESLFLLYAFSVGGLIYGLVMLLFMLYLIFLKQVNVKRYVKTVRFIESNISWF